MDQKNTIVKCMANPNCLFNHNGICDNYVITIGADGSCQEYVETAMTIKETKCCHEDCIHFDDSDPMVGPICLFKHPEPLKEFYEGMPCNYYHKKNNIPRCEDCKYLENTGLLQRPCVKHSCYKHRLELPCEDFKPIRGQRAKGSFLEDTGFNLCSAACEYYDFKGACMYCQLRQEYLGPERLMKPCDLFVKAETDKVAVRMKVAELNKPNKNKSVLQENSMCWYCDHGKHGKCKFPAKPMRDSNGECCRFTSTGGNR